MYHSVFIKIFCAIFVIAFLSAASIIKILLNKEYWEKRYKKEEISSKKKFHGAIVSIGFVGYIYFVLIPMCQDKKYIDNDSYMIMEDAIMTSDVFHSRPFSTIREISVKVDDVEHNFFLLSYPKGIEKGDVVRVIYLPHSRYAVVEKD